MGDVGHINKLKLKMVQTLSWPSNAGRWNVTKILRFRIIAMKAVAFGVLSIQDELIDVDASAIGVLWAG